ncbi:hypothetical protein WJX82_011278 [Trebouxia sp. C0006]
MQPATAPTLDSCVSSDSTDGSASLEELKQRKTLQNREHQRRFRLRRKARVQAVQAELAATTARLQELENQSKQSNSQPAVIRQIVVPSCTAALVLPPKPVASQSSLTSGAQPSGNPDTMLTLSVYNPPRVLSVSDMCNLPGPQLFAIWTSYVKELGQCLLQLETRADEQVTQRLTQLTNECQDHLNGTYQGLHPALAKAIAGGNLEQALATVAQLDHTFWSSILDVWQLSQPQVADIVYMRRLVLTRRAVLAEERSAILSQLAVTNAQMQNNKMEDVTVLRLTEALLKVSAEHRQALAIQTQAWGHGILTPKQTAQLVVLTYPHVGFSHVMLEAIATEYGEASKRDVEAMALAPSVIGCRA